MKIIPYEACVYTTVAPERLDEASKTGGWLSEKKRWVTGKTLLAEAKANQKRLLLLFSDAKDCSRLIGWGTLKEIRVGKNGTKFAMDRIWRLPEGVACKWTVLSSGMRLSQEHRRPYVLCTAPDFLFKEAKRPRRWLPMRKSGGSHEGNQVAPVGGNFAEPVDFSWGWLFSAHEAADSRFKEELRLWREGTLASAQRVATSSMSGRLEAVLDDAIAQGEADRQKRVDELVRHRQRLLDTLVPRKIPDREVPAAEAVGILNSL